MRLSIPVFYEGMIYVECEVAAPRGVTIADAGAVADREGLFQGVIEFLGGCVRSFSSDSGDSTSDQATVRKIIRAMPYLSAEDAAIKIMVLVNPGDKIEGMYECPRCHHKIITGLDETTGEDTRDAVDSLGTGYLEPQDGSYRDRFVIELEDQVSISNAKTGEAIEVVSSLGFRWPTLNDCVVGSRKYPTEEIKRQLAIYAAALVEVNGEERPQAYRATWGTFILNHMSSRDLRKFGENLRSYGIRKEVERTCPDCGRTWAAPINTANFFESGLRPG